MRVAVVAHSAVEYRRWVVRSRLRPDGMGYARMMRTPVQAPTLQIHGALDSCVRPRAARGSGTYVDAPYRRRLIDGAGPFPREEMPERLHLELRSWLLVPKPES